MYWTEHKSGAKKPHDVLSSTCSSSNFPSFSSHFILINRTIRYTRPSQPPPPLWLKPLPTLPLNSTFDHKKLTTSSTGLLSVCLQAYHVLASEQQDGSGAVYKSGLVMTAEDIYMDDDRQPRKLKKFSCRIHINCI